MLKTRANEDDSELEAAEIGYDCVRERGTGLASGLGCSAPRGWALAEQNDMIRSQRGRSGPEMTEVRVTEVGKVAERRMESSASVAAPQEGFQNLMSARASSLASCAIDAQWSQTLRALSE